MKRYLVGEEGGGGGGGGTRRSFTYSSHTYVSDMSVMLLIKCTTATTMALLTMALLTMALLTMALLTMALLTGRAPRQPHARPQPRLMPRAEGFSLTALTTTRCLNYRYRVRRHTVPLRSGAPS